jgi:hypothetical protein
MKKSERTINMVLAILIESQTPIKAHKIIELSKYYGLSFIESDLRKSVNYLRSSGVGICSDERGYYLSSNPRVIQNTIDHLEKRIEGITNAIEGLKSIK